MRGDPFLRVHTELCSIIEIRQKGRVDDVELRGPPRIGQAIPDLFLAPNCNRSPMPTGALHSRDSSFDFEPLPEG